MGVATLSSRPPPSPLKAPPVGENNAFSPFSFFTFFFFPHHVITKKIQCDYSAALEPEQDRAEDAKDADPEDGDHVSEEDLRVHEAPTLLDYISHCLGGQCCWQA